MHKQIQIVLYAMDIRGVSFDVVPKRFGHWVQKWEGKIIWDNHYPGRRSSNRQSTSGDPSYIYFSTIAKCQVAVGEN